MRVKWTLVLVGLTVLGSGVGCSNSSKPSEQATAVATPKLGIRPEGDETIHPDMSKVPPDLQKVFTYIDDHIDEHVENLQKWIQATQHL